MTDSDDLITCDLFDAHDDAVVLPAQWRSFGGRTRFSGPAATVRCFNDNSRVREVLATEGEGRVLVVDGAGSLSHALLGERIAGLALDHGWAGVVIYGAVRDSAALDGLDVGIAALGTMPRPSRKENAGVVDVEVEIAGGRVRPGDLVAVDEDGVVVIPA